ncbi:Inner membrane protein ybaL [Candidatus Moranella endobia PCVAL]|uniref:Putative cation:proton antiport protein n=1 Tax=Moranella endobia (strain PCIT) TaxID=903503 RepID=F7XX78_MOREP|nr:YbaL family putative K(+) efflux transporter [Candidatus Moranella endobia]AEI74704.1 putative cation:proton antiport protein [Candidatus Moranella endobia PCIT]AGJ61360.1 Inner membrane protein ybaL [Candidatus Moranella endobia PCVAL]
MHHATPLINTIVVGLVLAYVLGIGANRLRISPLVGYLTAGVLVGPFTPGFVADTSLATELAELGVILLMFGVGLHFSLKDLMAVKNIAIPGATAQIAVATLLGMTFSFFMGWTLLNGLVFGLCLSTASTVVLLRTLEERQLIKSHRGQIAIGWLIVEDLIMVMTLVLLPALCKILGANDNYYNAAIWHELALTISKVVAFITLMIVVGRRLVPWVLAKSASTGSRELFTLAVLALAMGIAFGAVEFFGVSFALGAFFAGVVLNESELSHRAAHDTLPLRDAFAVLFFVSVGMLFDPTILLREPLAVLATLSIIVLGKSAAAFVLVKLFGLSLRTSLTIAVSLAQIGEFAFILSGLGIVLKILSEQGRHLVLAGAIMSIMINPLIFAILEHYLMIYFNESDTIELQQKVNTHLPKSISQHALLVGYGRVGSIIGTKLLHANVPMVVVEHNSARVNALREQGINVVLGNAASADIMALARLNTARWLLVTVPNGFEAGEIVVLAREQDPDLKIIVQAYYDDEVNYITERGATQVVIGEREIANSMISIIQREMELQ